MCLDFYHGKFRFSSDCTSWNLVSSLGLLSLHLLVLKEERLYWLICACVLILIISWNFYFQNFSCLGLSTLTCKLRFTEQKFSIHGALWKTSKGHTLSLLILAHRSEQIGQCQLFAATADLTVKINYCTNSVLFSSSHPLRTN